MKMKNPSGIRIKKMKTDLYAIFNRQSISYNRMTLWLQSFDDLFN